MRDDELKIATKLIETGIAAGFWLTLFDEEGYPLVTTSRDIAYLTEELGATDYQQLVLYDNVGTNRGAVDLIFGNEPGVLIADHSAVLTQFLKPVMEYAETFEQ